MPGRAFRGRARPILDNRPRIVLTIAIARRAIHALQRRGARAYAIMRVLACPSEELDQARDGLLRLGMGTDVSRVRGQNVEKIIYQRVSDHGLK